MLHQRQHPIIPLTQLKKRSGRRRDTASRETKKFSYRMKKSNKYQKIQVQLIINLTKPSIKFINFRLDLFQKDTEKK